MDYMEDFAGIDIHDLLSRVEDPHFLAVRFCLTLGIFNTMSWKRHFRGMIAEDSINPLHAFHPLTSSNGNEFLRRDEGCSPALPGTYPEGLWANELSTLKDHR